MFSDGAHLREVPQNISKLNCLEQRRKNWMAFGLAGLIQK